MINNKSYIAIIIDKQKPITLKSTQAINSLIASRINAGISLKIACEPGYWATYHDLFGTSVEETQDYRIVELDDSYKTYIKNNKNF